MVFIQFRKSAGIGITPEELDTAKDFLTQDGLLLCNQTSESYTKFMDNFFAGIDPEKTAIFVRVLDAMIGFLQGNGKRFLVEDSGKGCGACQLVSSAQYEPQRRSNLLRRFFARGLAFCAGALYIEGVKQKT